MSRLYKEREPRDCHGRLSVMDMIQQLLSGYEKKKGGEKRLGLRSRETLHREGW